MQLMETEKGVCFHGKIIDGKYEYSLYLDSRRTNVIKHQSFKDLQIDDAKKDQDNY